MVYKPKLDAFGRVVCETCQYVFQKGDIYYAKFTGQFPQETLHVVCAKHIDHTSLPMGVFYGEQPKK
jgi:hypothetical protein